MLKWRYRYLIFFISAILGILILARVTPFQSAQKPINNCQDLKSVGSKQQCWEESLDQILTNQGLDAAFNFLTDLFMTDPVFASDCHGFAHLLGEKAYQLFSTNQDFSLSPKSFYCGYGFYHGFMEKLLHTTGDITVAQKFCDFAQIKLQSSTSDAGGACFHGIGHGSVDDVPDPKLWGKPLEIIKEPLKLCQTISRDRMELFRCTTGVFNALEILMSGGKYNLSLNPQDPFWICESQPENLKLSCYTQFVIADLNASQNNFNKATDFIAQIPEDQYALPAFQGLTIERIRLGLTDFPANLDFCHHAPARFQLTCTYSVAEGFMKYGPPQQEYQKAIAFCQDPSLTSEEKLGCFGRILSILRIWYPVDKSQSICSLVDKEFRPQNLKECQYQ